MTYNILDEIPNIKLILKQIVLSKKQPKTKVFGNKMASTRIWECPFRVWEWHIGMWEWHIGMWECPSGCVSAHLDVKVPFQNV